jgi:hypothetical protein
MVSWAFSACSTNVFACFCRENQLFIIFQFARQLIHCLYCTIAVSSACFDIFVPGLCSIVKGGSSMEVDLDCLNV